MKAERIKTKIKLLNFEIEHLKQLIEITKENMQNNFEDSNYKLVLDAMQLRKLNKKLKKYENKVILLKEELKLAEVEKEI